MSDISGEYGISYEKETDKSGEFEASFEVGSRNKESNNQYNLEGRLRVNEEGDINGKVKLSGSF